MGGGAGGRGRGRRGGARVGRGTYAGVNSQRTAATLAAARLKAAALRRQR